MIIFNFQFSIFNFLNNHTPLLYLTQSLWRDEAFSVLLSEPPLLEIIKLTASDFNPPLYYFILHFWMKIFGNGEIVIRMLSFIFHLLLIFVCYKFAQKLKFSKLTTYYLLLTTFLNPMLIYFAFEARMYSLLALLATASMYFFYTKNWLAYVITSVLGLWTQPFMGFVLLAQGVYLLLNTSEVEVRWIFISFIAILVFFSPWLPVILFQLTRSGPMWIWPINWTTVTTILGNLFTGYEGTPWDLWNKMKVLSLAIIVFSFLSRRLLFLTWAAVPVILVLVISYFKPIYVNRYLIFVTPALVFLIVDCIAKIRNRLTQIALLFSFFIFIFSFNVWFPPLHKKLDLKITIKEIEKLANSTDLVFSQTPLTFFEASYYFPDRSRVFLYNAKKIEVPYYAGHNLITKEKWVDTFPEYPRKAFLIHDDSTYEVISQK
ncbi:glycosyltransferase family 39 protein [Candidatus Gottesmanbacteria bacterium]|nr:glycosyltransferase family 39 protein [Candidatus Gottesmanbacteria bacterium]